MEIEKNILDTCLVVDSCLTLLTCYCKIFSTVLD